MTLAPSADELLRRARKTSINPVGMCLWQSQEWYGSPHLFASATKQWQGARHRHPGDRNPPVGAHVMWTGGAHGWGHSAIYVGGGKIRTIDMPRAGITSEVPLSAPEKQWGLTYVGWTEDIGGVRIPWLIPGTTSTAPANPNRVKVGDTAIVVTSTAPLLGRSSPGGPLSGIERAPGFTFVVKQLVDGWATGGKHWYSTDYLWPQLPSPGNPGKLGKGDRAKVTAATGLRARRFPGGPPSTDKNGKPIVRQHGWQLTITAPPVAGWVTGGSHWYSADYLAVVPDPPKPPPSKPSWTGPTHTLKVPQMPDPVTYLQAGVRVAPLANEKGSWPERIVTAQDPGKKGNTRFLLWDPAGRWLDEMTVLGGGHGQSFHAYRSAAGNLWIWTLIGDQAYRIQWRSKARVTAKSNGVNLADYRGRRPVGSHEPYVGFRGATATTQTFTLHDRYAFAAGRPSPLREVTLPKRTSMTQQSWAVSKDRIYQLLGATNQNPPKGTRVHVLDVYDWAGKLVHDRIDLTTMSIPTTSDEPEIVTFSGAPGAVLLGKREGGGKPNRSVPIWAMAGVS